MEDCCVDVAVSGAAFKYDRLYSYSVPEKLKKYAVLGARVLVPFGSGKPRMGIILAVSGARDDLKEIIDAEREKPLLNDEIQKLVFFLKRTTLCSYDDAVKVIIPKSSRLKADFNSDNIKIANAKAAHLENVYIRGEQALISVLTDKQKSVYRLLDTPLTYNEIYEKISVSRSMLKNLIEKGAIKKSEREKTIGIYREYGELGSFDLTGEQSRAYREITGFIGDPEQPGVTLLYGVTGSGKTVIYYQLVRDAIEKKRTALLLVPEIALATQLILRFKSLFGERVGVIHSGLSDTERLLQWNRIRSGGCDLVVGTRSAVFAPLCDIGIIIIDEEQEQSYLSEQNPRFNTLEVAKYRAKYHGAHLLLSSATPSIETYHQAVKGRYNLVNLLRRYLDMPLPAVEVVDMRGELLAGNSFCIGKKLKDDIDKRIQSKEQTLLLLNRRGYRTVSICAGCKTIVKCKNCDTALVYHKNPEPGRYVCHYCGHNTAYKEECAECGGSIRHTGVGTQKIEEELSILFPTARIMRLDVDSVGKKHSLEQKINAISKGEYDIIVGTQMIAKGLDFKNVTLVGVLSIDQQLLAPSFRANERAFSMLAQVIGRSGRGEKEGEAVIQSIDPDNAIIKLAAKQDFPLFYRNEVVSRKVHLYPPYCVISSVGLIGDDEEKTSLSANAYAALIEEKVKASEKALPIRVLGPSPMRIAYAAGQYRFKITLKSRGDMTFKDMIYSVSEEFYKSGYAKDVRFYVNFYDDGDV